MSASPTRVRLAEISRREIYLPLYGALAKGFFEAQGLAVEQKLTLGPDRTLAALFSGEAEFGMTGPEAAIYVARSRGDKKVKIVAGMTNFDGNFLVSRHKIEPESFNWNMLRGKTLLGWRPASAPGLFLEHVLRLHRIDPSKDIKYLSEVPIPARARVWFRGEIEFATFYGSRAARLERTGAGYPVLSIGQQAGPSVYTVFLATTDYVREHPEIVQKFVNAIRMGLKWTAGAAIDEAARTAFPHLSRTTIEDVATAVGWYRKIGYWKSEPLVDGPTMDQIQSMMIESGVVQADNRIPYEAIVAPEFAENAKRAAAELLRAPK